jgi:xanthine/CO dehydrogenase XdhC/CoxF family maturation factor
MLEEVDDLRSVGPDATGWLRRFRLDIDLVGSFLVCCGSRVRVGVETAEHPVEISLMAQLSRRHGTFVRSGEGYVFEALGPTRIDDAPATGQVVLRDRSRIRLGDSVELLFRVPSLLSRTARLEFVSDHRPRRDVQAVILLDETCVVGPAGDSHIVCRPWSEPLLLARRGAELWCQSRGSLAIDGASDVLQGVLRPGSQVRSGDFGFRIDASG